MLSIENGKSKTKSAPTGCRGGCLDARLGAGHVDSARSLFRVLHVKGDDIPFAQLVKHHVDESRRMKKHVLLLTFWRDETESFVGQALDCSLHRYNYVRVNKQQMFPFVE